MKPSSRMTFRELGELWTSGELHRRHPDHLKKKKTAQRDAQLLRSRVYPIVGDVRLEDFTLEHAEAVMRALPLSLAQASRRQHAQAIARVMSLAAYPVRAIERSPIPRGFVPPQRSKKAKSYLYPDEERRLMRCRDVPLVGRLLWGFLAREGMRWSEAIDLAWSDLDLARGAVRLDRNQTDDPRAWALGEDVVRALKAWRRIQAAEDASGPIFTLEGAIRQDRAADAFREHLRAAGVDRPELFERSDVRLPIVVHDLRGTFVTLALANGRTEAWVMDRTGHRSSTMVNRYRRTARQAAELGLGALSPLDEAIPELSDIVRRGG